MWPRGHRARDCTQRPRDVSEVVKEVTAPPPAPPAGGGVDSGGSNPYYSLLALEGPADEGDEENIVVDSGAVVTVLPRDFANQYPILESRTSTAGA